MKGAALHQQATEKQNQPTDAMDLIAPHIANAKIGVT
jgi:hypothetical protein